LSLPAAKNVTELFLSTNKSRGIPQKALRGFRLLLSIEVFLKHALGKTFFKINSKQKIKKQTWD
jgi:hypothetical protein